MGSPRPASHLEEDFLRRKDSFRQGHFWWSLLNPLAIPLKRLTWNLHFNPPRCSGLTISLDHLCSLAWIRREFTIDRHVKRMSRFTIRLHIGHDLSDLFRCEEFARHLIGRHEIDSIPACRSSQGFVSRPSPSHPHGNPGAFKVLDTHFHHPT